MNLLLLILNKYLKKMETQKSKPKYMDKDQQHRLMAAYYTAITDLIEIIRDGAVLTEEQDFKLKEMQKFFFNPSKVVKNEKEVS